MHMTTVGPDSSEQPFDRGLRKGDSHTINNRRVDSTRTHIIKFDYRNLMEDVHTSTNAISGISSALSGV